MRHFPRLSTALIVTLVALAGAKLAHADSAPSDVVGLEREVSLRLAHVRDQGPVDAAKREQLSKAAGLEQESEAAISRHDYKTAESDLLAAKTILDNLGE